MTKLIEDFLPKARILHPWPSVLSLPSDTRGKIRVPESGPLGSVQGAVGNSRPYCERATPSSGMTRARERRAKQRLLTYALRGTAWSAFRGRLTPTMRLRPCREAAAAMRRFSALNQLMSSISHFR